MHDVGWPYGRRDLYYAPEQIPEEFRQPYRRAGHAAGNEGAARDRRHEPDDVQRRSRRRPAQRRHDRARRLPRRVRPAGAEARRPRSTSGSRSWSTRSASRDDPSCAAVLDRHRERRGPARPCSSSRRTCGCGRRCGSSTTIYYAAQRRDRSGREPVPRRSLKSRAARRALPRERGAARSTSRSA